MSHKKHQIYKPGQVVEAILLGFRTHASKTQKLSKLINHNFTLIYPIIRIKSIVTHASYSTGLKLSDLWRMAGMFKLVRSNIQSFSVEQRSLAHQLYLQALVKKGGVAAPDRWGSEALHARLEKRARLYFQRQKSACLVSILSLPNPIRIRTLSLLSL